MIYCAGLELHALSSPTGTRYALGKAQLLSNKFSAAFNTIDQPLSPLDCPDELLITESDVFRYLASIDCSKATGPDLISGTMLKNTATAITPIVTALFNLSIKTCTFPNCWKISNVSPIPKGGNIKNPSNYRPVYFIQSV